jgi:hypothetical protein
MSKVLKLGVTFSILSPDLVSLCQVANHEKTLPAGNLFSPCVNKTNNTKYHECFRILLHVR